MPGRWRRTDGAVIAGAVILFLCGFVALGVQSGAQTPTTAQRVATRTTTSAAAVPHVRLPLTHLPATRDPLPGQRDIVFVSPDVGYLLTGLTVTGTWGDDGPGGSIQRTVDGGATWQTVWQSATVDLDEIASTGTGVVASGARVVDGGSTEGAAVLVASHDQGRRWVETEPVTPPRSDGSSGLEDMRLYFADPLHAYAMADVAQNGAEPAALRTVDGGTHWSTFTLPGGYEPDLGVAFVSPLVGFVTASRSGAEAAAGACVAQVLRTTDGGRTWSPEPGSCSPFPLLAVAAPDASHVIAGGGVPVKFREGGVARGVVASSDGGAHWTVRNQVNGQEAAGPFSAMTFSDATHGWAVTPFCTEGENGPCPGPLLTTSDGGRSWTQTSVSAVRVAVPAPGDVWALTDGLVLQHADPASGVYEPVAPASSHLIDAAVASGSTIYLDTNAGRYLSTDGGSTWSDHALPGLPPDLPGARVAEVDADGTVVVAGYQAVWVSTDLGRTGAYVRPDLPADPDVGPLIAASGRTLLAVEQTGTGLAETVSHDLGAHWTSVDAQDLAMGDGSFGLSLAGESAVVNAGRGSEPLVSADLGRRWQPLRGLPTPDTGCSTLGAGDMVGLSCADTDQLPGNLYLVDTPTATVAAYDVIVPPSPGNLSFAIGDSHHLWTAAGPYLWESSGPGLPWRSMPTPWDPRP